MKAKYRALAIVAIAAGVAVAHVEFKPDLDRERIRHMTNTLERQTGWIGKVAPDFEFTLQGGQPMHLADEVGKKVVVLNFFATWCAPCKKEMPELERYQLANAAGDFLLVGIDVDEDSQLVADFVSKLGLTFPIGIDQHAIIASRYGVRSYPTTVVIGVNGRVRLYEGSAIANADVTFGGILAQERTLLAAGKGIKRDEYLAAAAAEVYDNLADASKGPVLTGRALAIAGAMRCTCGCDFHVGECNCGTAKEIKKKLAAEMGRGTYDKMSDAEVMAALDKEFCLPGKQNAEHH
jgi:thiol-disulfide isomerase/thioredoxin